MDSTCSSMSAGATVTPANEKYATIPNRSTSSENRDPNVPSHQRRYRSSPPIVGTGNGAIPRKANHRQVASPPSLSSSSLSERKFVVAKRKSRKEGVCDSLHLEETKDFSNITRTENEGETVENGELGLKRNRDRVMEAARQSVPESGSGRVMHLVMAFEKLRMISNSGDENEDYKKGTKWALPGLHQTTPDVSETKISPSSFNPSDVFLTPESFGLDSGCSYSFHSSQGSISTATSAGGRKSKPCSKESSGTVTKRNGKRKQKKETTQRPFMLRTEQRGKSKEEQLTRKLQQMLEEEERLRRPVAQALPWTTDEPEFLSKPLIKENTRPADLILRTDTRAVERTEFDNQVVKKKNMIEQYRLERERQKKQAEEEEIRRLRKELVPKAQPLPYFDKPFIPRRSRRQPTIPKDPKFHLPRYKKIKCNLSLDIQLS